MSALRDDILNNIQAKTASMSNMEKVQAWDASRQILRETLDKIIRASRIKKMSNKGGNNA